MGVDVFEREGGTETELLSVFHPSQSVRYSAFSHLRSQAAGTVGSLHRAPTHIAWVETGSRMDLHGIIITMRQPAMRHLQDIENELAACRSLGCRIPPQCQFVPTYSMKAHPVPVLLQA